MHTIPKEKNPQTENKHLLESVISFTTIKILATIIFLECNHVNTHTTLHILDQNRKTNTETENKQLLQSVISFTIHL